VFPHLKQILISK